MNQMGNCIVIGAGEWRQSKISYDCCRDFCVAVDGGLEYCKKLSIVPDLVVGDFDSIGTDGKKMLERFQEQKPDKVVRLNPEKDDTDMLSALRIALEKGYRKFFLYAATGGRLEHTIANIQCLLFLKRQGAEAWIVDGMGGIFVMENETKSFLESQQGYVSVFTIGDRAEGVTLRGLKYPLENYTMTNDYPIGISNEFIGEQAVIEVREGTLVVIMENM